MPEDQTAQQTQEQQPGEMESSRMPFMEHLDELRARLIRSLYAVLACMCVAFAFNDDLYDFLKAPLIPYLPKGSKLIFTAPAELFFTYMKISMLAGVVAASPVIFYQLWRFVAPGLYKHERKLVWPFVGISSLLFICGTIFCYAVIFPVAFQFFMSMSTEDIVPMIKVNDYLSFSASMLFIFGVIFETPLIMIFLAKLGVVNAVMLRKKRRYAILIMFVIAAVATPTPDVVNQFLMVAPLMLFYEVSIFLITRIDKKRAARQAAEEAGAEE
jgi:sec-independent protein translocase protein TatC